ncbi:hypothetical protein OH491_13660 [Termitidicoccus mucosus]|uniref:Uncharacterized protein n=1 Tax=Termitidicoccus mucosus TaxID=1184151 RepID=A0A178IHU1_9BACT|nr:hypothetical protein AW736_13790 [Opitutaceae bacterium TSB47]
MPAPLLKHPELMLDFLIPAGREKLRLDEVARILSDDGGKPVSVQSLRNGLESGAIFGARFNFSARPDARERHRLQWMLRGDVLLALLEARTAPEDERLRRFLEVLRTFSREALDMVAAHTAAARARAPMTSSR